MECPHLLPPEAVQPEDKLEVAPEFQADVEKEKQLIREVSWPCPLNAGAGRKFYAEVFLNLIFQTG